MENIDITLQEPSISNVDSVLSGPQGPKGDPGEPGRDGISPTVNVGEVTTLNSGHPATVTNVGSDSNVILNFGIPQGPQGIQGVPGVNGADGTDGVSPTITVGSTYTLQPDQPATVENVGSDTEVILNFGIPQGRQGDTSGCLSVPTIVNDFPATANPATFYFIEKEYTETTITGDNLTLTIGDNAGRISTLSIHGYLNSSLEPLTGDIDITVDGNTTTVPLDSTFLAEVNGTYDEISNDGIKWYLTKRIGYIESYNGETITTDYVSTSGTLTLGDEVYYVLEDEEIAEIENSNITSPLNAIRTYNYQTGTVTITTSANVTANLEISYHTIDINNQYDKYVYMIDTANWEVIGGGDSTIADGSITTNKLANLAVTTGKIDSSAVTTTKIANSAITTNKLDDNSVTSAKIGWSSMPVLSKTLSSNVQLPTNTSYNSWASLTITEPGTYLLMASGRMTFSYSGVTTFDAGILLNSSASANATWSKGGSNNADISGYHRADITFSTIATLSANDVVHAVVQAGGTSMEVAKNSVFMAVRIS